MRSKFIATSLASIGEQLWLGQSYNFRRRFSRSQQSKLVKWQSSYAHMSGSLLPCQFQLTLLAIFSMIYRSDAAQLSCSCLWPAICQLARATGVAVAVAAFTPLPFASALIAISQRPLLAAWPPEEHMFTYINIHTYIYTQLREKAIT